MPLKKGVIHIYTGDGKGKTTASMGLAAGLPEPDLKCLYASFLKMTGPENSMYSRNQII